MAEALSGRQQERIPPPVWLPRRTKKAREGPGNICTLPFQEGSSARLLLSPFYR